MGVSISLGREVQQAEVLRLAVSASMCIEESIFVVTWETKSSQRIGGT